MIYKTNDAALKPGVSNSFQFKGYFKQI